MSFNSPTVLSKHGFLEHVLILNDLMKSVRDSCSYEEVSDNEETIGSDLNGEIKSRLSWRNFLRQMLVCSTMWTLYFIYGLQFGVPTVLIAQMRKEPNSTSKIDDDLASWISSMMMVGAIPWSFILPILEHAIGRKKLIIFISLSGFIGGMVIYLSNDITKLLVGEFIVGIIPGGGYTVSPIIITEYSSPKYRGIFLTMKSATFFWGMWVANIIGTFYYWKNIYLIMFLCNAYTLSVFAWPESPYWLAKEKRFKDCAIIHRKLKGKSREAERELDHLINQYKLNQDVTTDSNNSTKTSNRYLNSLKIFSYKAFYKPLLLAILLAVQYNLTGKLICSIYAVQILKKITGTEDAAYKGMLILDGVTVFSAYCGSIASRFCKRRTMLLSTTIITITLLYILAVYFFLTHSEIIKENNFISISLLAFFSLTVCSGQMILMSSIYAELISIRYQRPSTIIYGAVSIMVTAVSVKISLFLFKTLTLPGTFLFFAISSSICTFLIYLYLPETKNKSIQEIEQYFMDTKQTTQVSLS